jgi:hypothetical protein
MKGPGHTALSSIAQARVLGARWVMACVTASIVACGGGASPSGPVQECKDYERKLSACVHRDLPFATQASLLPKSREDRERIRELCLGNLQRLNAACR